MNKQAKIGFLFIFFSVCLLSFIFWIQGNPFQSTRTLRVIFSNVHGVSKGSKVEYSGVECGKVKSFFVTPRGVLTTIELTNPDITIYEGDRFFIAPSSTIASEYEIFITPSFNHRKEVSLDSTIIGQSPPTIQDFLFQAEASFNKIDSILEGIDNSIAALNPLFENVKTLSEDNTLEQITDNLQSSTQSLKNASLDTEKLITRNKNHIENTIVNLSKSSSKAEQVLKVVDPNDVQAAITATKNTAQNIEALTGVMDSQTLKQNLQTFTEAADQVKQISQKLQSADPNEDVPTLVKNTAQRIDRLSEALENSIDGKTPFRAIFSRIRVQDSSPKKLSKIPKANIIPTDNQKNKEEINPVKQLEQNQNKNNENL